MGTEYNMILKQAPETNSDCYQQMLNDIKDYAIILLNESGHIQSWNLGAAKMKGYTEKEALGKDFGVFYTPEEQQKGLPKRLLKLAGTNGKAAYEGWRVRKNGSRFWGHVIITALYDSNHDIIGFSKVTRDLTERLFAEIQLKESEQRFRSIFNSMYQFIGLMLPDGTLLEVNKTALSFAGLQEKDVIGKSFWDCHWWLTSVKTREQLKKSIAKAATGEFIRYEVEVLGKNNTTALIDFSIKPITDDAGKVIMLIPEGRDITHIRILQQQFAQEEENRKNEIFEAIIKAQEREREEISYELHDNINQLLATCKLLLEMDLRNRKEPSEYVTTSYNYIESIIQELRKISGSLCAYALKDIGFVAAMKDLIEKINSAGKISIHLNILRSFKEQLLEQDFKTIIFRIIQEQVNNVLKHAEATNLYIIIERKCREIILSIKDDGKGFNIKKVRRGLGINNIYNRVEYLKGKAVLTSQPRKGCSLQVTLPIPAMQKKG